MSSGALGANATAAARSAAATSVNAAARWALAVHIYVSEGRDRALVSRLAAAGAAAGVAVANEFVDVPYHRSGVTFASGDSGRLEAAVTAVCREALAVLDLREHRATHPRVGVVDHVACNPLGSATSAEAGVLAARVGRFLSSGEPGKRPAVPVYFYGAARPDGRPLAELRRSLGYFAGAKRGEWVGLSEEMAAAFRALPPDMGPSEVDARSGAAVVGAVPWVTNYNLLLTGAGLGEAEVMSRCRRIARSTSTRGGGLNAVETMALPHERGVEVACNLLDVAATPPSEVRSRVADLAKAEGLQLDSDYFTNKTAEEVLTIAEVADSAFVAKAVA